MNVNTEVFNKNMNLFKIHKIIQEDPLKIIQFLD